MKFRAPLNVAQTNANGIGSLVSAFLNRDQTAAQAEMQAAPSFAQAAAAQAQARSADALAGKYGAETEGLKLKNDLQRNRGTNAMQAALDAAGATGAQRPALIARRDTGGWGAPVENAALPGPPEVGYSAPLSPAQAPAGVNDQMLRAFMATLAATGLGAVDGGNSTADNLAGAERKMMEERTRGDLLAGAVDPQAVARAEMAMKGTRPFAFNEYGTGNTYTGAVDASGPVAQRFGAFRQSGTDQNVAQAGAARANATQSLAAAGASRAQGDKYRTETDLLRLEMPGAPGAVSTAGGRATLPGVGKAPTGYLWGERDAATGTPTLIPVKGGPADKGPANATEDERKAAGWVAQAQFAFDNVQKVLEKSPNANRPVLAAEAAGMLPGRVGRAAQNSLTPESRQQFEQAANSFAEAALRAATGAGVNRDEAQQKVAELTPQIGDRAETIRQKKEAWGVYLDSLRLRAGRALPPSLADAARGAAAPPSATPGASGRNVRVTY